MINTSWNPNNENNPEIDKITLKPDKHMKKTQGSRYDQNAHNSAAQNDETLKTAENTKAQANWTFDIVIILLENSLKIDKNTKMHKKTTEIYVLPKQRICTLTRWHQPENESQNHIS